MGEQKIVKQPPIDPLARPTEQRHPVYGVLIFLVGSAIACAGLIVHYRASYHPMPSDPTPPDTVLTSPQIISEIVAGGGTLKATQPLWTKTARFAAINDITKNSSTTQTAKDVTAPKSADPFNKKKECPT